MKLEIELIPAPLQYKSLNKLTTIPIWKSIKEDIFQKEGKKCWICNSETQLLQAHEFWEYDNKKHIQKLIAIHHLCLKCHMINHILFATETKVGEKVLSDNNLTKEDLIKHFCIVNNCSKEDYEAHYKKQVKIYIKRSNIENWKQDLGEYRKYVEFQKKLF